MRRLLVASFYSFLAFEEAACAGRAAVAEPPPSASARPTIAAVVASPTTSTPGALAPATSGSTVVRKALFARLRQDGGPATVRDVRPVHLSGPTTTVTFRSLPSDFDAHGFDVRPASGSTAPAAFHLLETRVQGTSPSLQGLLKAYAGKPVRVRSGDEHSSWEDGTLVVATADMALVSVGGNIEEVGVRQVAFVDAPSSPILEASVQGGAGDADVELTYSTALIHSMVSYGLVRFAGSAKGTLGGSATLTNASGTDLPNAMLTLSADAPSLRDFSQGAAAAKSPPSAGGDTTLIRFATPISMPAGRSVSTRLFGPSEVVLTRRVVIEGLGLPVYSGTEAGEMANPSVRAVVDATAAQPGKLSPLGMLPGSTELFEADAQSSDPPRKYGDTNSRPLPGGVGLRVDLGDERQFETRRRFLGARNLGRCVSESAWEVSVTNPTEEPIPFEDVEPVSGDYVVLDSSLPVTAKEKDYFGFEFPVAGKATVKLRFRARVTSCVETRSRGYWYGGGSGKPGWSKSSS